MIRPSRPVLLCAAMILVVGVMAALAQVPGGPNCGAGTGIPACNVIITGGANIGTNIHASNGDNLTDTANALDINVKSTGVSDQTVAQATASKLNATAKVTDGTNTAAVKAASTAPSAADPALVVAISPNGVNANGSATSANSAPVVVASDQAAISVKQATGTNLHAVLDTTSTTAATQATGTNLHAVTDSTSVTTLIPATTGGNSMYTGSITNTAVAVDASAGQVYGYIFYNGNTSVCYVQFWNTASGSVVVGTTAPVLAVGIPANGGGNVAWPNGLAFSTAITIAATTTRSNGTACSSNVDANVIYK